MRNACAWFHFHVGRGTNPKFYSKPGVHWFSPTKGIWNYINWPLYFQASVKLAIILWPFYQNGSRTSEGIRVLASTKQITLYKQHTDFSLLQRSSRCSIYFWVLITDDHFSLLCQMPDDILEHKSNICCDCKLIQIRYVIRWKSCDPASKVTSFGTLDAL